MEMDCGRENNNSKMDDNRRSFYAENLLNVDVKRTAQDNQAVKGINLDIQSYVDALEIATIELVFNDFYYIVFFSKQWTKLDIFFKKSTNDVI